MQTVYSTSPHPPGDWAMGSKECVMDSRFGLLCWIRGFQNLALYLSSMRIVVEFSLFFGFLRSKQFFYFYLSVVCSYGDSCRKNHNDTMIKNERRLLLKNMYLSLYCKGLKRVTQGFTVRESWRLNKSYNILTPTLMAISVVSFSFSWCSTVGPGTQLSAECWLSLPYLVTNGSTNSIGGPEGLFG